MIQALINSDIAPLYATPDTGGELADEALYGMEVMLKRTPQPDWYEARTHYRYKGFVERRHLCIPTGDSRSEADGREKMITAAYIDLLAMPKVSASRLACAPRGGLLTTVGEPQGGWQEISTTDGRTAYAKAGHLSPLPSNWRTRGEEELRFAITNSALGYLGAQYRWGGKTILGIDCSGLTSMAYMLNGVLIYRDAKIMPGFPIHEIGRDAMRAGDLMFFTGHVAIYLGNDAFIHSTAFAGSDGVVINSTRPGHPKYSCREDLMDTLYAVGSIF